MIQAGIIPSLPVSQCSDESVPSQDEISTPYSKQHNQVQFGNDTLKKSKYYGTDTVHKLYVGFPTNRLSSRAVTKRRGSNVGTSSYKTHEEHDDLDAQSAQSKVLFEPG